VKEHCHTHDEEAESREHREREPDLKQHRRVSSTHADNGIRKQDSSGWKREPFNLAYYIQGRSVMPMLTLDLHEASNKVDDAHLRDDGLDAAADGVRLLKDGVGWIARILRTAFRFPHEFLPLCADIHRIDQTGNWQPLELCSLDQESHRGLLVELEEALGNAVSLFVLYLLVVVG
jgi:hypothetical protein